MTMIIIGLLDNDGASETMGLADTGSGGGSDTGALVDLDGNKVPQISIPCPKIRPTSPTMLSVFCISSAHAMLFDRTRQAPDLLTNDRKAERCVSSPFDIGP